VIGEFLDPRLPSIRNQDYTFHAKGAYNPVTILARNTESANLESGRRDWWRFLCVSVGRLSSAWFCSPCLIGMDSRPDRKSPDCEGIANFIVDFQSVVFTCRLYCGSGDSGVGVLRHEDSQTTCRFRS